MELIGENLAEPAISNVLPVRLLIEAPVEPAVNQEPDALTDLVPITIINGADGRSTADKITVLQWRVFGMNPTSDFNPTSGARKAERRFVRYSIQNSQRSIVSAVLTQLSESGSKIQKWLGFLATSSSSFLLSSQFHGWSFEQKQKYAIT
ncbi:hypothetical protein OIU74_013472 [Salix koriyanagi]|uniref:Uncharacterized protein n=1 Tax=Salix koriyanagi TaxID=2511006 RepID=A0A9Q0Q960_9ROSI|nr:hypothetical protein OIU74_013472 [Salix koriyanagi]